MHTVHKRMSKTIYFPGTARLVQSLTSPIMKRQYSRPGTLVRAKGVPVCLRIKRDKGGMSNQPEGNSKHTSGTGEKAKNLRWKQDWGVKIKACRICQEN